MDSLTQAVLGGATALVVTGGKSPRKAVLFGAAIATLPDLDILVPYDNVLEKLVAHRTWSHSWLVQTAITPVLALLLHRFEKNWNLFQWMLMIWLVLITHTGLDALTVFGTDIFWPLSDSTLVGGSVFIIDPAYTLLLLIPCLHALFRPKSTVLWRNTLLLLAISSTYLIWGFMAKAVVHERALDDLTAQGIKADKVLVQATPFNTLLWRIVAINKTNYYEGFHSVFDNEDRIILAKYPRNLALLSGLESSSPVQLLIHFNHDYFFVQQKNDDIVITDLRMGSEPFYSFQFKVAEINEVGSQVVSPQMLDRPSIPQGFFSQIWYRIFNQN